MANTVHVVGLRDLIRSCTVTEVALGVELKAGLLEIAEIVSDETENLMGASPIDFGARTISGITARANASGAFAQQSRRKSSSLSRRRNNFGGLQMRKGFLPAIENKKDKIEAAAETTVQGIVDRYFD